MEKIAKTCEEMNALINQFRRKSPRCKIKPVDKLGVFGMNIFPFYELSATPIPNTDLLLCVTVPDFLAFVHSCRVDNPNFNEVQALKEIREVLGDESKPIYFIFQKS